MTNAVWTAVLKPGLAGAALLLSLGAATPTLALEDGKGSPFDALMGVLGVSSDKDEEIIQYRDRPPLVVPPKTDLRQPLPPPAARTAAWPQDQELVRAKKKQEERRRVRTENVTAQDIRNTGRIDPRDQKERPGPQQGCDMDPFNRSGCSPQEYWNRLATERMGDTGKKTGELRAGVEPPREYLTQPPKGYMAPKNSTKATFEPLRREEEDIRDFFRKKPNADE